MIGPAGFMKAPNTGESRPTTPEPEGLGKWCGWCGRDIRRKKNKVWRAGGTACFCDQECHDECESIDRHAE